MGREDVAGKNEQMSVGPDIKELQIPSVECKLSCKQQKAGRDFCQRRVTGLVLLFWKANLKWGVLQHIVPGGKQTRLGSNGKQTVSGLVPWLCQADGACLITGCDGGDGDQQSYSAMLKQIGSFHGCLDWIY